MRTFVAILAVFGLSCLAAHGLAGLERRRFGTPEGVEALAPGSASGPARRVIALTPALAEIVFAIGAGDRLAGVSSFCTFPPETARIPSCGGAFNPSLERIVALAPDLILIQGEHRKVRDLAEARGIPLRRIDLERVDDIWIAIREIGRALGEEERASALEASLRERLEAIRSRIRAAPPVRTLVVAGRMPGGFAALTAIGGASFISDLLAIAGGENVFADIALAYPSVSRESLVRRAPEVVIELRPSEGPVDEVLARVRGEWAAFRSIPAVANGRIHVLTEDYVLIPGPRVVETARDLARVLHPRGAGGDGGGEAGGSAAEERRCR
ncbi:MAG: ABC transporter substrate-binding protein [Planctomycetes bacterium]|nr:ABC transporter substrate-binding protein [Planctomycetota bacterium]